MRGVLKDAGAKDAAYMPAAEPESMSSELDPRWSANQEAELLLVDSGLTKLVQRGRRRKVPDAAEIVGEFGSEIGVSDGD